MVCAKVIVVRLFVCLLFTYLPTVTPVVAYVLGAAFLTIIMHSSVVGSIRNGVESLKGGLCGCLISYVSSVSFDYLNSPTY